MLYKIKKILLEQVVRDAYYSAKEDNRSNLANDIYTYSKKTIINSRQPNFKYSDYNEIREEYEKINPVEAEKEYETLPAFLENDEEIKSTYTVQGRYDSNGVFHKKPSELKYFDGLIEEEERDLRNRYCSRLYVIYKTNFEGGAFNTDEEIEKFVNREVTDIYIYSIEDCSYELLKEDDEDLYELCFYWILSRLDIMDINEFLSYQLQASFCFDLDAFKIYIKTILIKYKKEYDLISKESLKTIKLWMIDINTIEKNDNEKELNKTNKKIENITAETILKTKGTVLIFFQAMKQVGILPKNITIVDMARIIHLAYGISYDQITSKWSDEINKVKNAPRTTDKTKKLQPIFNGLELIEKCLKEDFKINN